MLKVQLSASYYHVVQAERMQGLVALARRTRPDLVICAMTLPDGSAIDACEALRARPELADIPVIAVTAENDRAARLAALEAGIDDVMSQPLDDLMLQARIRSLLRMRIGADMPLPGGADSAALGFSEPAALFAPPARIALLTRTAATAGCWKADLEGRVPHTVTAREKADLVSLMAEPVADAFVVEVSDHPDRRSLTLLADLRARGATHHSAVIAVIDPPDGTRAAQALDLGAHDVMTGGFCAEELALRLKVQLQRKALSDRRRASVRNGLRAAVTDPLTGLYNRRYALPQLAGMVNRAHETGGCYAVMLADLDHFKQVNDRYGHPAGDAVLVETARRLRGALGKRDLIARVGGEEFMIALPDTGGAAAHAIADRLCRRINAHPFRLPGHDLAVPVTISIGVVPGGPGTGTPPCAETLIGLADRALYGAKDGGRNMVSMVQPAA